MDYVFTTDRVCSQPRLSERRNCELWLPDYYEEIWCWLKDRALLGAVASINQGLQHKGKGSLPRRAKTDSPSVAVLSPR